jgi:hypothetical protein
VFQLRKCIEESLDLVAIKAAEKRLDIAYILEPGTKEFLVTDSGRIRQMLVNYLSNAVKYVCCRPSSSLKNIFFPHQFLWCSYVSANIIIETDSQIEDR